MGESTKHSELVKILYRFVISEIPPEYSSLVACDGPQSAHNPQRNFEGFRPDVEYFNEGNYIVGEAKTTADLLNAHSIAQYSSYLTECSLVPNSCFILAVPLEASLDAKALIHNMLLKKGVEINYTILNEAGSFYEYKK